jgi:uncharacterized membrane protein YesL
MKQATYIVLQYIIGYGLVLVSHAVDPTNMAGTGLDMLIYPIVFIAFLFLFGKSVYDAGENKREIWVAVIIHSLGLAGLIAMLFVHG